MNSSEDIARLRLGNQCITLRKTEGIKELVAHMGAMQAQDLVMVKWALGLRISDSKVGEVDRVFWDGEIIRTHLLRPTWHLVSANDIHWMLDLTGPRIKSGMKGRHKRLGLDPGILKDCFTIIGEELAGGRSLTRAVLMQSIEKQGISTRGDNKAAHILLSAEIEGLICSGRPDGRDITYALLKERVPVKTKVSKDQALKMLAERYFLSHGPATADDFAWWSGLAAADVRQAIGSLDECFTRMMVQSREFIYSDRLPDVSEDMGKTYLVPAYDEILISYSDRSAMLRQGDKASAISSNGIFRPVILIDGKAAGLWRRSGKDGRLQIEVTPFRSFTKREKAGIGRAVKELAAFYDKKADLSFH